jgi:hypothetical protein
MSLVHGLSVFDRPRLTAPPLWLAVALPIAHFTAAVVTVSLLTHNTRHQSIVAPKVLAIWCLCLKDDRIAGKSV